VSGKNAEEVAAVSEQLAKQVIARREAAKIRSPWVSGSFYLAAAVVIVVLLLAVGRVVSFWALPVVVVGALLLVMIVGAYQMRQDARLSEKGFLQLMADVLKRLPLVVVRSKEPPTTSG
jgi:predicted membrane channel-forming protein YqfA (hemolysin III family)